MREWTPARRRTVEAYVASLQGFLRLSDWTIDVDWSRPCPTDAFAAISPMGSSRHATLFLSPEFLGESPSLRSQILLHELMHCHFFPLEEAAEAAVGSLGSDQVLGMFKAVHTGLLEMTVDTLADAFVPLVPALSFRRGG